ncbi:ExeM/NucH family extracellular endonuclease [Humidisolicoccus flavus]|uniref:ExeM/NucH family extracellular endonuclease n=1 Tax=Humidisolicoccus flavus TaxID=3111414 RepID=UPI0032506FF5
MSQTSHSSARKRRPITLGIGATALAAGLVVTLSTPISPASAAAYPVINEFVINHVGDDINEYIEVYTETPDFSLDGFSLIQVEGDTNTRTGQVISSVALTEVATDENGFFVHSYPMNGLQNGSSTIALIEGSVALDTPVDGNNDGLIDSDLGFTVVDSVALLDSDAGDRAFSETILPSGFQGSNGAVGGASRVQDGVDTNTADDWVINHFNLVGLPGIVGDLTPGQALNTPGQPNRIAQPGETLEPSLPPANLVCGAEAPLIGEVQGESSASPIVGQSTEVEGVVTAVFAGTTGGANPSNGFSIQGVSDDNPLTSDGIFVQSNQFVPAVGTAVRVAGPVEEAFGMTQIKLSDGVECDTNVALPAPVELTLPIGDHEPYENMLITLPQELTVLETYEYGRYGTIALGTERQFQPTAMFPAGSPEAAALMAENNANRITLDDNRGTQNPDPAIHPNGEEFTLENSFRSGDLVANVTGVLGFRFDVWGVQPSQPADFTAVNDRPEAPEVGGELQIAAFNVLNYFTTIGGEGRGATSVAEFERQEAKIVAALLELDADIVGLMEIENNDDLALNTLVAALNEAAGEERYAGVQTGNLGTDAITTALIFKPSTVAPQGAFTALDESIDPRFDTSRNRPALTQTFVHTASGELVTVAVNHLKSKGSSCGAGDDDPDAGSCNLTRTLAAQALGDYLATDPTGQGSEYTVILGDLNSYDKETPIVALKDAGFVDLLNEFVGEEAYTYEFDGMLGYLDYALTNDALAPFVTDAAAWHTNADEVSLIDYTLRFKQPAQQALWAPDAYRASDHDAVIFGLQFSEVVPTPSVPVETPPGQTPPGQTPPGETSPGATTPGESAPGASDPGSSDPAASAPASATPAPGAAGLPVTGSGIGITLVVFALMLLLAGAITSRRRTQ